MTFGLVGVIGSGVRRRLALFALVLLFWAVSSAALWSRTSASLNALTCSLFIPLLLGSGFLAGLGAGRQSAWRRHEQRVPWLAAPRRPASRAWRAVGADLAFIVLLPQVIVYAVLIGACIGLGVQGYFDATYVVYGCVFSVSAYLFGSVCGWLLNQRYVAVVLAVALGLYAGSYTIQVSAEIDAWSAFPPDAWTVTVGIVVIAALALTIHTSARAARAWTHRVVSLSAIGLSLALVAACGSQIGIGGARAPAQAYACRDAGIDRVCVWPEDGYKLDSLSAQVARTRSLLRATGGDDQPLLYLEPGVPGAAAGPEWSDARRGVAWAIGGAEISWPAAQSIFNTIDWRSCARPWEQTEDTWRRAAVLGDLATNYVYGDVSYSGFSSSDGAQDTQRAALGASLATMDDAALVEWIGQGISEYQSTCDVSLEPPA